MKVTLIAAVAENGVIGRGNELPWRIPEDLKFFKGATLGKPIIMGRNTWDSIGRPLPQRTNIVMTKNDSWSASGALVATNLTAALELAAATGAKEAMVIGGAQIYREALECASTILLTRVHGMPEGDTMFPEISSDDWDFYSAERHCAVGNNPYDYSFCELRRRM